jgi:hypothetical protein
LAGNRSLFSPKHVTGVNAAAKAAVSTSARSTVARIIAVPFNFKGHPYLKTHFDRDGNRL